MVLSLSSIYLFIPVGGVQNAHVPAGEQLLPVKGLLL